MLIRSFSKYGSKVTLRTPCMCYIDIVITATCISNSKELIQSGPHSWQLPTCIYDICVNVVFFQCIFRDHENKRFLKKTMDLTYVIIPVS